MPARSFRSFVAATVVLALAAAVAPGGASAGAATKSVDVVAAFYPVAWVAEQIGGKRVAVTNLTPAGTEPHDLELTPDQRDAIEDADLVVVMGSGFQPAVEDAAEARDSGTLELLARLPILPAIAGSGDSGVPAAAETGTPAGDAFRGLAEAVAQQVAISNTVREVFGGVKEA